MPLPRTLDPAELRVLGCLLEKERTTPDAYPLTLNSLIAACNQKSNRHPVMSLTKNDVLATLDRLHSDVLVWPVDGARVQRWRHSLDRRLGLEPPAMALMTLFLLRGPQTTAELRSRSERLHPFRDTAEVEACLLDLSSGDHPFVTQMKRGPGQKERRWMHLVGGDVDGAVSEIEINPPSRSHGPSLADRVTELEERVAQLERLVNGPAVPRGGDDG